MKLSTGIVGLPNVGKSTLFNTLTNSRVLAANYRFATIEPNIAVINLPDPRLKVMQQLYKSAEIIPATFKFVDIAGLIAGASKGEGLGNKFLSNIREVSAICHVVRCFADPDVMHEYDTVDPVRDVEIINLELILSDLEVVTKRWLALKKKAESGDKEAKFQFAILDSLKTTLENGALAKTCHFEADALDFVGTLNLITMKPCLYVANIDENNLANPEQNQFYMALKTKFPHEVIIPMSVKIESEISQLDEDSRHEFMETLGMSEPTLDHVIRTAFSMLNLSTFFTCGPKEIHAWTFINGQTAPQCAGIIHTDFERGFIRAEVLAYNALVEYGSELGAREHGKIRSEGKNYLIQDGDICHFLFNV